MIPLKVAEKVGFSCLRCLLHSTMVHALPSSATEVEVASSSSCASAQHVVKSMASATKLGQYLQWPSNIVW